MRLNGKSIAAVGLLLARQAAAFRTVGATSPAELLDGLSSGCAVLLGSKIDKPGRIDDKTPHIGECGSTAVLVRDLRAVIEPCAKTDIIEALDRLAERLEEHGHMSILDLVRAWSEPDASMIDEHAARLDALLGDPQFPEALAAIVGSKAVKAADVVRLANLMKLNPSPKLTKPKAIAYILKIHRDVSTFRAKKAAMDGRSAA